MRRLAEVEAAEADLTLVQHSMEMASLQLEARRLASIIAEGIDQESRNRDALAQQRLQVLA